MDVRQNPKVRNGFTLIELLVVITVIAILTALLFPAFKGVQDQAKRTQARNDVTQIVTAVNAFYTEYGTYPLAAGTADVTVGGGGDANNALFTILRGLNATVNPRNIIFISPPDVKDPASPRSGIGRDGQYFDPWGKPYAVAIDGNYDGQINNPYGASGGAGSSPIRQGVIAWSLGKDGSLGLSGNFTGSDDVISWQ